MKKLRRHRSAEKERKTRCSGAPPHSRTRASGGPSWLWGRNQRLLIASLAEIRKCGSRTVRSRSGRSSRGPTSRRSCRASREHLTRASLWAGVQRVAFLFFSVGVQRRRTEEQGGRGGFHRQSDEIKIALVFRPRRFLKTFF